MTSTPSVFALPERLVAKADVRLIGTDTERFSAVTRAIDRSLVDLTARLDALRATVSRAGWEAVERDAEVKRVSREIRVLQRLSLDLCLGRFVRSETSRGTEHVYIGRFGLVDEQGRRLLIDWRVPAAAPYFSATRAQPMGLTSRRRYRWNRGRIVDYWDEVLSDDVDMTTVSVDDESAFIAGLGAGRTTRMRDVLSTIQADQDAIIRAPARGALVVDGGPGTGKTVVALHRTAYLLYADPAVGEGRGGVLFVGPHRPYLAYVADVLPSLGEEGVQTCTLRDLAPEGPTAVSETDPAVATLKESASLVDAVESAVRYYERRPESALVVTTPWGVVHVGTAAWEEAFAAAEPGVPHNDARDEVWNALLDSLVDAFDPEEVPTAQVRRAIARDDELAAAFAGAWPILDPVNVVADLWSSPSYLRLCAPWLDEDAVRILQRPKSHAWTTADLPFLDAARRRIGDPLSARRARVRDQTLAAERLQMERVIDDLIAADDDGEGLVTMLRGEDARESLTNEASLVALDPDHLVGPFSHIVVDEAQELTDAEWRMLLDRCPSRSFTVVGDRAQARRGFTESWTDRLERVGFRSVEVAQLRVNYRTPEEIMMEATPLIRAVLPDANVPTSIRRSGVPVVHGDVADLYTVLNIWLAAHTEGTVCVIGDDTFEPLDERVRVLAPELTKGLEFDLVILVNPERFGPGTAGAVDRYVAMTRATQELVILRTGARSD